MSFASSVESSVVASDVMSDVDSSEVLELSVKMMSKRSFEGDGDGTVGAEALRME
jgi:hypothetical protein